VPTNNTNNRPPAHYDGPWHPSPLWPFRCRRCERQITEYYTCHAAWPSLRGLCAECVVKPHLEHHCGTSTVADANPMREAA
jgi:hypothetical protein